MSYVLILVGILISPPVVVDAHAVGFFDGPKAKIECENTARKVQLKLDFNKDRKPNTNVFAVCADL